VRRLLDQKNMAPVGRHEPTRVHPSVRLNGGPSMKLLGEVLRSTLTTEQDLNASTSNWLTSHG